MDIFFQDPTDVPQPPGEIRIRDLQVIPLQDKRRMRVHLEVTPFLRGPNVEIQILPEKGDEVASLSIIESIDPVMEFTLHLREDEPSGNYTVSAIVYYYAGEELRAVSDSSSIKYALQPLTDVQVVDRREVTFTLLPSPDTG